MVYENELLNILRKNVNAALSKKSQLALPAHALLYELGEKSLGLKNKFYKNETINNNTPFDITPFGLLNSNIKILAITDNIIPHEKRFGDYYLTKFFISSCDAFLTLSASVLEDLEIFTKTTKKIFIPHPIYDTFGDKLDKSIAQKNISLNSNDKHLLLSLIHI